MAHSNTVLPHSLWHLTISDTFLWINIILGRSGTTSSRAGCGYLKHTAFPRVCGTEWKSVPRRALAGWRTQKRKELEKQTFRTTNHQTHPNTQSVKLRKCIQSLLPDSFFFFWHGPFLKSLLNLLQHCFCFMFWFFDGKACRILTPQPGIKLNPLHWKVKSSPLDHQGGPCFLCMYVRIPSAQVKSLSRVQLFATPWTVA